MPHVHEKIDFTVETFIVHGDRVLLRMHDKYKIWLSIGGHIELDEDPNQAAVREAMEEVGLQIALVGQSAPSEFNGATYRELLPPRYMNRHRISDMHEHVTLVYFATSDSTDVRPSGDDQSDEWRWFSAQDLDDPSYGIRPSIVFFAREALNELADVVAA